jgi:RES domain
VSSTTWTQAALGSELRPWRGALWRAVEAQHRVATARLVDTLQEQALLEDLLEDSKPALARSSRHYLLTTPFRYPPPHPGGSRFRGARDAGVFYGAEDRRTACAELGYWRWRFLLDSPKLARLEPLPQTLFQVGIDCAAIDLTLPPLARDAAAWRDPADYGPCQQLARQARAVGAGAIRYCSVRDPEAGACGAVLSPRSFAGDPDSALLPEGYEFECRLWVGAARPAIS